MIDIHNHILPGIDDGASDIEDSIEMARIALSEGFSGIVATPHYGRAGFFSDIQMARRLVEDLRQELAERGIDINIFPGMEVLVCPEVIDLLNSEKIIPVNDGIYILLELPAMTVPAGFNNLIKSVLNIGKKVIIVHPEKNMEVQRRSDYVFEILNAFQPGDVLIQVTADSLTGDSGLRALSTAKYLIENRMAHIIATDAHGSTARPPRIAEALDLAISLVGKDVAVKMVTEWPEKIVNGDSVIPDSPQLKPQKRKWWQSFLGK